LIGLSLKLANEKSPINQLNSPIGDHLFTFNKNGYPPKLKSYDFLDFIISSYVYFESRGELGFFGGKYFHGIIKIVEFEGFFYTVRSYWDTIRGFIGNAKYVRAIGSFS